MAITEAPCSRLVSSICPEMETANWRAVCGKTACTVRREGRLIAFPTPIRFPGMAFSLPSMALDTRVPPQLRSRECGLTLKRGLAVLQSPDRGVGKATNLPSLRTVQAVLPHTALQSAVSISGQIDDLNLLQGASVIATE